MVMLLMLLPLALIAGVAAPAVVMVNEVLRLRLEQQFSNQEDPQLVWLTAACLDETQSPLPSKKSPVMVRLCPLSC